MGQCVIQGDGHRSVTVVVVRYGPERYVTFASGVALSPGAGHDVARPVAAEVLMRHIREIDRVEIVMLTIVFLAVIAVTLGTRA